MKQSQIKNNQLQSNQNEMMMLAMVAGVIFMLLTIFLIEHHSKSKIKAVLEFCQTSW